MINNRSHSIAELAFQDYDRLLDRAPQRCRELLEGLIASPPALTAYEQAQSIEWADAPASEETIETPMENSLIDRIVHNGLADIPDEAVRRLIHDTAMLLKLQMTIIEQTTPGSYWSWAFAEPPQARPYPIPVEFRPGEFSGANRIGHTVVGPRDPFDRRYKLIETDKIKEYVDYHAGEIADTYHNRRLFLVAVATGGCFFATDLSREVAQRGLPHRYESILVRSYDGTESRGVTISLDQLDRIDFKDYDILLTDDIWDTGQTMATLLEVIWQRGPRSIQVSTLLRKRHDRAHPKSRSNREPGFVGFVVPDVFVVGYGLDFIGYYRHLQDVWVCPPDVQEGTVASWHSREPAVGEHSDSGQAPSGLDSITIQDRHSSSSAQPRMGTHLNAGRRAVLTSLAGLDQSWLDIPSITPAGGSHDSGFQSSGTTGIASFAERIPLVTPLSSLGLAARN
jgi:hypoxanthine phosphoribosyltransferase